MNSPNFSRGETKTNVPCKRDHFYTTLLLGVLINFTNAKQNNFFPHVLMGFSHIAAMYGACERGQNLHEARAAETLKLLVFSSLAVLQHRLRPRFELCHC